MSGIIFCLISFCKCTEFNQIIAVKIILSLSKTLSGLFFQDDSYLGHANRETDTFHRPNPKFGGLSNISRLAVISKTVLLRGYSQILDYSSLHISYTSKHDTGFALSVIIWFLFNILRTNWQNDTKFCIHIIIDKIYVGIVKRHFLHICNRVTALDLCQNLVLAEYLENELTE